MSIDCIGGYIKNLFIRSKEKYLIYNFKIHSNIRINSRKYHLRDNYYYFWEESDSYNLGPLKADYP